MEDMYFVISGIWNREKKNQLLNQYIVYKLIWKELYNQYGLWGLPWKWLYSGIHS